MKTLLLAGVTLALLTAANFAPAMAQGPKLSIGNTWAGISQPVDDTQPIYPIPGTMYGEVISKYRIGSDHKAVYENLTRCGLLSNRNLAGRVSNQRSPNSDPGKSMRQGAPRKHRESTVPLTGIISKSRLSQSWTLSKLTSSMRRLGI